MAGLVELLIFNCILHAKFDEYQSVFTVCSYYAATADVVLESIFL